MTDCYYCTQCGTALQNGWVDAEPFFCGGHVFCWRCYQYLRVNPFDCEGRCVDCPVRDDAEFGDYTGDAWFTADDILSLIDDRNYHWVADDSVDEGPGEW